MGNNRRAWQRFFNHFHILQQDDFRTRFPNAVRAAYVSLGSKVASVPNSIAVQLALLPAHLIEVTPAGNMAYRTFASRIQSAVDDKDFSRFEREIRKRPGHLFRNLASMSHVCIKATEGRFVELVRGLIDKASPSILMSLIQIDVQAKYRIIDSKGNTTVTEADYHPVIGEVQGVAERELYRRFGFPGQVLVEPGLENKIVPFLSTNSELDRGSKIPFEDLPYLYFLMHWVQTPYRRTDLDHSYLAFNSDWSHETIYFGRQANNYISQSGDITNAPAPNGGTEYGCISLDKVPSHVRYIVPIINVYCGDAFADLPTAYAGFMFSHSSNFKLQREHVRYDLSQPAQANIPFVIDMEKREIIIVDFNNRIKRGVTAHDDVADIKKIISALKTKKFLTIGRFAEMLSGDDNTISLKIGEGGTHPNDLSELVS
jgi:stress response protein SCP2